MCHHDLNTIPGTENCNDKKTTYKLKDALHPLPGYPGNSLHDIYGPSTMSNCVELCEKTSGCDEIIITRHCHVRLKYQCFMMTTGRLTRDGTEEVRPTFNSEFGCDLNIGAGAGYHAEVWVRRRTCGLSPLGGISDWHQFGDADEESSDIAIAFVDTDNYPEVITSSGRDHVRVYRGTDETTATADFSRIVPETFNPIHARALQQQVVEELPGSECAASYVEPGETAVACCGQLSVGAVGEEYICPIDFPVCKDYAFGVQWGRCHTASPYTQYPGDARDTRLMANVQQIFVSDFDRDGRMDIFLHAPALSPGSCAQRCHSMGRFGYDSFKMHHIDLVEHAADASDHEESYCYCGPHYHEMVAPHPPPSPPKPPPSPGAPPSIPPIPSPGRPPPSPPFPVYRAAGMCILHADFNLPPTSPGPPPSPPQTALAALAALAATAPTRGAAAASLAAPALDPTAAPAAAAPAAALALAASAAALATQAATATRLAAAPTRRAAARHRQAVTPPVFGPHRRAPRRRARTHGHRVDPRVGAHHALGLLQVLRRAARPCPLTNTNTGPLPHGTMPILTPSGTSRPCT